ncbi:MAG: helix-turn-helix transcriptional regulator [Ignavibacteria bacterium]|nr:helix-turn-helix transcriptional regulator [Ignavibacteria bacterium]
MDEKIFHKYGHPEHCPVRNVMDRIGDKWSVLVLLLLEDCEVLRFNEICNYIKTISQKMLASTLRSLEADGLVSRQVYAQIPPKVEYRLTERGKSLLPHLHNLVSWAAGNMDGIQQSRKNFEGTLN